MTEVCDVCLGNYSAVILSPESNKHLHCYFAPESKPTMTNTEQQVLLIPFIEDMTDENMNMVEDPVPLAQPCGVTDLSEVGDPSDETEPTTGNAAPLIIKPLADESSAPPDSDPDETVVKHCNQPSKSHDKSAPGNNPEKSVTTGTYVAPEQDLNVVGGKCQESTTMTAAQPGTQSSADTATLTFQYITLDLLKDAASTGKKTALTALMSSLGLKSSNNVTMNKRKLCDLLESCVTDGKAGSVVIKLITHLVNKLEDTVIKVELLANELDLSYTARDRKKDLISFYKSKCSTSNGITRLAFGTPSIEVPCKSVCKSLSDTMSQSQHLLHPAIQPSSQDPNSYKTPEEPISGKSDTKFNFTPSLTKSSSKSAKKKKGKRKKKKHAESTEENISRTTSTSENNHNPQSMPQESDLTTTKTADHKGFCAEEPRFANLPLNTQQNEATICSDCSDLKLSLNILQDSIISLKEEMLQQKAISDLVISTPTTSEKKFESIIKGKLGPLEDKLHQARADIENLKASINKQNELLADLSKKSEAPKEMKSELEIIQTTNSSNKKRIEILEIGQDNLNKAIKSVANSGLNQSLNAVNEVKEELNNRVDIIDTTSCSNRARIDTLETNHENLLQTMISPQKTVETSKNSSQSHATIAGLTESKPHSSDHHKGTTRPKISTKGAKQEIAGSGETWSNITSKGASKPFTTASKLNCNNHREGKQTNSQPCGETQGPGQTSCGPKQINGEAKPQSSKPKNQKATTNYRRHTALLIHDDNFDDFDGKRFNRQFNVHTFKAGGYADLLKQSEKLNSTIKRLEPECIYVHTGMGDVLRKKSGQVNELKEFADHLLNSTNAQICFSALIPSSNNEDLNKKINAANKDTKNYISRIHEDRPELKDRIFTFTNDSIGALNPYVLGTGFQIKERGQKLLYLRLKDGLRKTMRLPRIGHRPKVKHSTNRYSNE